MPGAVVPRWRQWAQLLSLLSWLLLSAYKSCLQFTCRLHLLLVRIIWRQLHEATLRARVCVAFDADRLSQTWKIPALVCATWLYCNIQTLCGQLWQSATVPIPHTQNISFIWYHTASNAAFSPGCIILDHVNQVHSPKFKLIEKISLKKSCQIVTISLVTIWLKRFPQKNCVHFHYIPLSYTFQYDFEYFHCILYLYFLIHTSSLWRPYQSLVPVHFLNPSQ